MKIKKNFQKAFPFLFIFISVICISIFFSNSIETLSKYGSRGEEVKQIQTKLKRWGYYTRKHRWNIWF